VRVPLASSGLRPQDIIAAVNTLKSGKLTMGEQVKNFESAMANYLKRDFFIMMNSGSSANLAMIEALLRPSKSKPHLYSGDGVLVPAIAWPTTIWPIVQLGLIPVFTDVDLNTAAMDLNKAQEIIDISKFPIKGLFPIHPLGYSLNNQAFEEFAARNDLILINDVCESLGSWRNGLHAGNSGLASSFSFYFSHHITTMEGGGVATDSLDIANDLRSIRSHGWSRDRFDAEEWTSNSTSTDSKFLFVSTGFNIRPMEIQASIGLLQIADINSFISRRRLIAREVKHNLAGTRFTLMDGGCLSETDEESAHSWMLLAIKITGLQAQVLRKPILEKLNALEIETRPILTGNFLEQPAIHRIHRNLPAANEFPAASEISRTCFMVSAHHDLTDDQVEYLAKSLRAVALEFE
jgi:CDP-6-deoxy-D-xylo-4-hexulose-3-dehydrase